jgi:hypothetical protein
MLCRSLRPTFNSTPARHHGIDPNGRIADPRGGILNTKGLFLAATCTLLLSGCASEVIHSYKSATLVEPVSRINVVFAGSHVQTDAIQVFGLKVSEKLQTAFSAIGIASEAKTLPPSEIPNSRVEYRQLFSRPANEGLILSLIPGASSAQCYGNGCTSTFQVKAYLFRAQTGALIWNATVDMANSKISGYASNAADSLSKLVFERLKTDGIISSKQ